MSTLMLAEAVRRINKTLTSAQTAANQNLIRMHIIVVSIYCLAYFTIMIIVSQSFDHTGNQFEIYNAISRLLLFTAEAMVAIFVCYLFNSITKSDTNED